MSSFSGGSFSSHDPASIMYLIHGVPGARKGFYDPTKGKWINLDIERDADEELPVRYDFPDAIEMEPVMIDGEEVWQMTDTGERDWFN